MRKLEFICANPRPSTLDERNDCTVRATTLALDKDYIEVHKAYSEHGRKNKKGVVIATVEAVCSKLAEDFGILDFSNQDKTLKQFILENPKGHYVMIKRKHAFAVKNGVVYDDYKLGGNTIIRQAIKVKD